MTEQRLWAPVRRLGDAAGLGAGVGAVLFGAFLVSGDTVSSASATSFALGALVLGFGLTVWATTLWMGDVFETFLETTVGDTEWTKHGAAVGFSLITALGVGVMVGSVLATLLLRALGW